MTNIKKYIINIINVYLFLITPKFEERRVKERTKIFINISNNLEHFYNRQLNYNLKV